MKNLMFCFGFLMLISFVGCGLKDASFSNYFKADKIYKIVPSSNYDAKDESDAVKLLPIDLESGFIHVAFGNQVEKILKKFFTGIDNVLVLELDQNVLAENGIEMRKERNNPGGDSFPHLYGKQQISVKAVASVINVEEMIDGSWSIVKH
ncbi:MAG: hypothetical protein US49_C0003G0054 [candidate division TM6 bacterium GW2011_GWF2_37_49]|nr:MAG: hypothetical protein US49_C0003G0054 [candidate division TM6 bacterium GW2011_GWF2_37_49]